MNCILRLLREWLQLALNNIFSKQNNIKTQNCLQSLADSVAKLGQPYQSSELTLWTLNPKSDTILQLLVLCHLLIMLKLRDSLYPVCGIL